MILSVLIVTRRGGTGLEEPAPCQRGKKTNSVARTLRRSPVKVPPLCSGNEAVTGISRCTRVSDKNHRSGFTLVEMLLVLGVLVVFAGMTVPSVMRMFQQQKLTGAAERVRGAIASARFRAIESGLIYQFCFEPGGTRFVVVPFEPDHAVAKTGGQTGPVTIQGRASGALPKGLTFSSISARTSTSSTLAVAPSTMSVAPSHKLPAGSFQGLPNAGDLASASWSAPILFHPEGSANSDIELRISDTRGQYIRLNVRAFTGAVSMERVVSGK